MRHVVIDTNCLLQMISRHNPYYRAWSAFDNGRYYICVSNDIINEYREIIEKLTNALVADNVIATIIRSPYCLRYDPHFHFGLITQDPDENKFVDCAIIANAGYVVSEDSHFNEFKDIPFPQVNVLKINEFMADIDSKETEITS